MHSNDGLQSGPGPERNNGYHRTSALAASSDPAEQPSLIGQQLTAADFSALESRWVTRDLAEAARLRRVDSFTGADMIGRRNGNFSGIAIPYFAPGSNRVREYRLRRDQPDLERDATGQLKTRQKYLSPAGRGFICRRILTRRCSGMP